MKILQVDTGAESLQIISELRAIFQKKLGGDDVRITNGYILNKSYMDNKKDALTIEDWDCIRSEKVEVNIDANRCVTKFRLSEETAHGIDELVDFFSEAYGMRVRKNFVVKMILKRELLKMKSAKSRKEDTEKE